MRPSTESDLVDEVYDFPGLWDTPSRCGLKIVEKGGSWVVIATELYDVNPGTSVTQFAARLATRICAERGIPHDRLIFVEHCPDRGSRLEFYDETFDRVTFDSDGTDLVSPQWSRLSREELEDLIR